MSAAVNKRVSMSAFARRVALYVLASLPEDAPVGECALSAGALLECGLDRLDLRDRAEAGRVRRVVREIER